MSGGRKISFDILRIIAAFSVVMLHVCGNVIYSSAITDAEFKAANFLDSVNRFGVPIFVMISGAIFLNKERTPDVKRLWKHNIARIIVAYIFWSYLYYDLNNLITRNPVIKTRGIRNVIDGMLHADSYLWFILMLATIYALIPVLRKWTDTADKKNIEYFLILFVIFGIMQETIVTAVDSSLLSDISGKFYLGGTIRYFGYFVLGHYIAEYGLPYKIKRIVYWSLPVDIAANYFISALLTAKKGEYHPGVYDSFGLFTFLEVVALFVFVSDFCEKKRLSEGAGKFIVALSADTFGIYLLHELLLNEFGFGLPFWEAGSRIPWIIPMAIGTFVVSAAIIALIRRIPVLGKWIV